MIRLSILFNWLPMKTDVKTIGEKPTKDVKINLVILISNKDKHKFCNIRGVAYIILKIIRYSVEDLAI